MYRITEEEFQARRLRCAQLDKTNALTQERTKLDNKNAACFRKITYRKIDNEIMNLMHPDNERYYNELMGGRN